MSSINRWKNLRAEGPSESTSCQIPVLLIKLSTMAAIAAHHWVLLVLIASAAGEVLRDHTTPGNATAIEPIAPHSPPLNHPGLPSRGDWAAESFPATGPYQAPIAEGVDCQLNSCCSYTSKTLPLPPSSTAGQEMGGIWLATAPNCAVRKPGNTYLARPATNGQPHEMTAHPEPRPTRLPRGEQPSRGDARYQQ